MFGLESPLGIFPPGIDPSKMYNPLLDLPDPRSMHPDHTPFLKKKREYLRRLNPLHSALISAYINRRQIILFVNTFRGRYDSLNFAGGEGGIAIESTVSDLFLLASVWWRLLWKSHFCQQETVGNPKSASESAEKRQNFTFEVLGTVETPNWPGKALRGEEEGKIGFKKCREQLESLKFL